MAKYDFTFTNTGSAATINSGNPVWFVGSSFTDARKALNQSSPRADGSLPEANQGGYEAPVISIQGVIDMDNTSGTHTVNDLANCTKANQDLLNQLVNLTQSTNSKILFRAFFKGNTGNPIEMRNFSNTTGGMNIVINSLNIDVSATSEGNHIWNVNMKLTETQ